MRSVRLLERDSSLASLREYAEDARRGAGRLVLVAGEAGVGKTALLECLEEQLTAADWAWGGCDGLSTPRPLGPLFDIAARIAGDLLAACQAAAPRETLFQSLLRQVDGTGRPAVLVIEDAHWADEATLDLVRFLGRRIRDTHVLLVVTYRDDGLRPDDPLRVVIGELASHRSTRRIGLAPLSEPAVRELAAASRLEPAMIYELTGGNPFYVTELLRSGAADPGSALPGSAHDAVMARVAALDADARRLLDVAALAGARVEPWVLRAISDDAERGIDACLASGVMTQDASGLRFRHELARLAVADAVPVHRRPDLHRGLLDCLRQGGCEDDARLAHHAEGAGDATAVLEHAPRAARQAARLSSHREAFAQYQRALRFADGAAPALVAALYDGLGQEASLIDRWQEAADALHAALPLWRAAGEGTREGDSLRRLSKALYRLCRGSEAFEAAERALAVLEPLPAGRELAWAYANLASHLMLQGDRSSLTLARRAQGLAGELGLADVLSDALNTEGSVLAEGGPGAGTPQLRRALEVALAAGLEEQAGRAYTNLQSISEWERNWPETERIYLEGAAYCDEHDLATFGTCLRGGQALALVQQGRLDEALALGREALGRTSSSIINRLSPLVSVATVLARRDDPAATAMLDEAVELADGTLEPSWIAVCRLARVEAAWLSGRTGDAAEDLTVAAGFADRCDASFRGAIAVWLRRLGLPATDLDQVDEPFASQVAGRHLEAAEAWTRLGCPYEAAMAQADSDEENALRSALATFDALGTTAPARLCRARMRRLGVKAVPVGPRAATRSHPLGLTRREQEVLDLLCAGLANAEISRSLVISERTVDHHVSAVLTKMGVRSRSAAATEAARLGLSGELTPAD
jgi:DNA-binding CsgD family transcriptional regulator/tetratricopeptide (TPR) repeat protein/type II secretory pathway predicted ATPase ExeA